MKQKTKTFAAGGHTFQLGRFAPEDGSFILFKVLTAASAAAQEPAHAEHKPRHQQEPEKKPTGEDIARVYAGAALASFDREMFRLVQRSALGTVALLIGESPVPIRTHDGRFVQEVDDDPALLMKLTTEALVFNITGFFDQSLSEAASTQGSTR